MNINAFYHKLDHYRGGALAFLNMVCGLAKKHDINVYTFGASKEFLSKFNENNINVTTVDIKYSGNVIMRNLFSLKNLSKMKKLANWLSDCDLVFVDGYSYSQYILPHIKNKLIFHLDEPDRNLHEFGIFFKQKSTSGKIGALLDLPFLLWDYKNYRRAFKKPKVIVANSNYSKAYIQRVYGSGLNVKVLYLGVDKEIFKPMDMKKEIILSVGALFYTKAHDFVIRALSLIKNTKANLHIPKLLIVGSGQDEYKLLKLSRKLNVDMEIRKNVSFDELAKLYNKAILTAIAYINEPFGLTAVESMACGTPVVAVKEGGVCESVIDCETGYLVKRDEKEFANAIRNILNNKEMAKTMGERGIKRVMENFTWEHTIQNLNKIIEGV